MAARTVVDKPAEPAQESPGAVTDITESDIEELRAAIAQAAYYKAEKRGFSPGYEEADWLEAENEIMSMIREKASSSTSRTS